MDNSSDAQVSMHYAFDLPSEGECYVNVCNDFYNLLDQSPGIPYAHPKKRELRAHDIMIILKTPDGKELRATTKSGGRDLLVQLVEAGNAHGDLPLGVVEIKRREPDGMYEVVFTEENRLRFINYVREALGMPPEPERVFSSDEDDADDAESCDLRQSLCE